MSWVRSLEPIEKPSKISRNSSASSAFDGTSHIMMIFRPSSPCFEAVGLEHLDDLAAFVERAHERDHDPAVGQAHLVAHLAAPRGIPARRRRRSSDRRSGWRRGSRSSGSLRAARSALPPIRLAYSFDLKSDRRTITGCGANEAVMRGDAFGQAVDVEVDRVGVAGDLRVDLLLRRRVLLRRTRAAPWDARRCGWR